VGRTSLFFRSRDLILAFGAFAAAAALARATPPQPPIVTDVSPRVGTILGGTGVTFTGSNFTPPMHVLFGQSAGLNCTTPVNGSFTCNTPPAPIEGLVDVTVENQAGNTSTVIPSDFLYTCAHCTVFPMSGVVEGVPQPGGTTEPNGILEPGETNVSFAPSWFNNSNDAISSMSGVLSELSQDSSYSFTASTSSASYSGPIGPLGGVGACMAPCYQLNFSFTGARPQAHVDVSLVEIPSISGGPAPDSDDAHRWTIHVGGSFTDVLPSNPLYTYVENLLHNQVTFGTGGSTFSPNLAVPRGQMAAFLARAMAGGDENVVPSGTITAAQNPAVNGAYDCESGGTSLFADVAPTDAFCRHIHFVAGQNITIGCDAIPDFCPGGAVLRRSMAVFVARALVAPGGDAQVPDANTGVGGTYDCVNGPAPFLDVPTSDPNCKQIGYIWSLGIVNGIGGGNFGPDLPTTRGQMAKFIVNAFHLSITKPASAQPDVLLAGNSISVHPGSFSASGSGTFLLPSGKDAPTTGGATLRVFDTGTSSGAANFPGTGGAQIIPLPAAQWTMQSTVSGPKFVYTGAAGVDPCTSVTISSAGQVTASCSTGITLQTPFSGDAALILDAGASRFCATWQGTTKKNDATGLTRSDSPPPARCPAVEAAPQAIQFTAPIFANGLTVYQLFPLRGAKAPNVDALTITKVTQPLVRMAFYGGDGTVSAGCQPLVDPVPCTRQVGVVSIAPDGKSLVYDLNPGQAPQPVPSFPEATREPLGEKCNLGTIDPANPGTTGTAANPSLYCVRGDEPALLGFDLGPLSPADACDDRISQWPFPFQFTVSDGVTESTQTMILTMYDHSCVPVNLSPPTIVTVQPDLLSPPQLVFGPTGSPTVPLNLDISLISLAPVPSGLPGGSGGSFTVPANCPVIPNVPNPTCTASGTISADPSSLTLVSSAGTVVQLNQPLTVTTYSPISQAGFNSVTITRPRECIACYLTTQLMTLFRPSSNCGYLDGTTMLTVDCTTGEVNNGATTTKK